MRRPVVLILLVGVVGLAWMLRPQPPAPPHPPAARLAGSLNDELRRLPPPPAAGPRGLVQAYLDLGYPISSPYGPRAYWLGSDQYSGFHTGVDFALARGTVVPAPAAGTVAGVAYDSRRGWQLLVWFPAQRLYANYCHADAPPVWHLGQHFNRGDSLYVVGNSGRSSGPHLHLEFMDASMDYVDPSLP